MFLRIFLYRVQCFKFRSYDPFSLKTQGSRSFFFIDKGGMKEGAWCSRATAVLLKKYKLKLPWTNLTSLSQGILKPLPASPMAWWD